MRDDPLRNLAVVQAVKDVPQLYERDTGIPKKELERLWNQVGAKVDLPGLFVLNVCVIHLFRKLWPLTDLNHSRHECSRPVAYHSWLLCAVPADTGDGLWAK